MSRLERAAQNGEFDFGLQSITDANDPDAEIAERAAREPRTGSLHFGHRPELAELLDPEVEPTRSNSVALTREEYYDHGTFKCDDCGGTHRHTTYDDPDEDDAIRAEWCW